MTTQVSVVSGETIHFYWCLQ